MTPESVETSSKSFIIIINFIVDSIRNQQLNRIVYQKCVTSKQTSPSKTQNKWLTDCQITCFNSINWKMVYKLPFSSTKISKLIIFQFKLLHGRLATNDFLNKIGIRPDDLCTFWRDERESLIHLFWSCRKTSSFWKNFQDWVIKNLILLKPNSSLSSAAVLGLKANFFSNTKQSVLLFPGC